MPRALRVIVLLAAACAASGLLAQQTQLPPNPHEPLNQADACPECHEYWNNQQGQRELLPDVFVVSIPEMCWVCHPQEKLGRSHPIGVDPTASSPAVEVPEEIPLENGCVSCGSCHVPHGEYLATTMSYPEQEPLVTIGEGKDAISYYKTDFLRIPGNPAEGFTPLCRVCHPEF